MRLKLLLLVAATLITSLILSPNAFAARVLQVKGKQVLIDLEGDAANVGDKYFVMIANKKRGVVTIKKVSKARAIATLDKGKAEVKATLSLAKAAAVANNSDEGSEDQAPKKNRKSKSGTTIGVLAGYSMDSQTAKLISPDRLSSEEASMSGSGFSLLGFADIPYSGNLGFVGRAGFETFSVTGTSSQSFCSGGTSNCLTKITYLTLDALIRYEFGSGGFVPFVAGGLGIYYPLSKETTALSPDIGMSTVFLADLGVKYYLSPTSYIPAMVEYGLFPPGPDVSTSIIAVRVGYGMSF